MDGVAPVGLGQGELVLGPAEGVAPVAHSCLFQILAIVIREDPLNNSILIEDLQRNRTVGLGPIQCPSGNVIPTTRIQAAF